MFCFLFSVMQGYIVESSSSGCVCLSSGTICSSRGTFVIKINKVFNDGCYVVDEEK